MQTSSRALAGWHLTESLLPYSKVSNVTNTSSVKDHLSGKTYFDKVSADKSESSSVDVSPLKEAIFMYFKTTAAQTLSLKTRPVKLSTQVWTLYN